MATEWAVKAQEIAAEIAAHAAAHDADDSFVAEGFAALDRTDFFSALVPAELGGGGASVSQICDMLRIIGASCGSTALAASMHSHIVAVAAWRHALDLLRRERAGRRRREMLRVRGGGRSQTLVERRLEAHFDCLVVGRVDVGEVASRCDLLRH